MVSKWQLPEGLEYHIIEEEDNKTIIRCSMESAEEVPAWVKKLGEKNACGFIVAEEKPSERLLYRKYWICQHNQKNKVANSKRCTKCPLSLNIKIKKINRHTKRNDKFLCLDPPLPCIVTITGKHNHSTESADAMRCLRSGDDLQEMFLDYYNNGMTASEAMVFHKNKIRRENGDRAHAMLANSRFNPLARTVYMWHTNWKKTNFGPINNPMETLKKRKILYEEKDCSLFIKENDESGDWAVVIVTPTMRRAQSLSSSKEIIFLDSTSSVDSSQSTTTVMLTSTPAGAVPVAVMIHNGQSQNSYKNAFKCLHEHMPHCFGGNECPEVFMSDDSAAEKLALAEVWPNAVQLLCQFHVAQAEWPQDNLQNLKHTKFVRRVTNFMGRSKEWISLYRISLTTRGHNTNNYSEATIRILKDVVLCRTKAFNIVALVDYCVYVWEDYYINRILDFAHNRKVNKKLFFKNIDCSKTSIERLDGCDDCFQVRSFTTQSSYYEVNTSVGFCSCHRGCSGAFCKHQAVVQEKYGSIFPDPPVTSAEARHNLGKLALGAACPPLEFFLGLTETPTPQSSTSEHTENNVSPNLLHRAVDTENQESQENLTNSDDDLDDFVNAPKPEDHWPQFMKNLNHLHQLAGDSSMFQSTLQKINCSLKRIQNEPQALNILLCVKNAICGGIKTGGKIKVQPTSIARRRSCATRGSKRIAEGRPPNGSASSRPKRPRILSQNVRDNVAHAKSHGSGH
ncbi:hypothetical protein B566_EDAN004834 [Ephemera danica]|nr:hypothetical protein B566_EDAN004834 [Ephemera danica]